MIQILYKSPVIFNKWYKMMLYFVELFKCFELLLIFDAKYFSRLPSVHGLVNFLLISIRKFSKHRVLA